MKIYTKKDVLKAYETGYNTGYVKNHRRDKTLKECSQLVNDVWREEEKYPKLVSKLRKRLVIK